MNPTNKDSSYYIKRIGRHLLQYLNFKTLRFNFTYFPFSEALLLPVYVHHRTRLCCLKGRVVIKCKKLPGMITIGYGHVPVFNRRQSRCVWNVKGEVVYEGGGDFGHGVKLCVYESGSVLFGDNIQITAESAVLCEKKIVFGNDCLISWDVLVMDSDLHKLYGDNGIVTNNPAAVTIGDRVWIGCRCTVLKGARIPKGCVVGSGSMVTKQFENTHVLISGNPAVEKRKIERWSPESFSNF